MNITAFITAMLSLVGFGLWAVVTVWVLVESSTLQSEKVKQEDKEDCA